MHSHPATKYDVVVAGGGMAGLTAALVLARARRKVAVVDAGSPRNAPAGHVHGYPGRDGTPPEELLESVRREVRRYGVELVHGTATGAVLDDGAAVPGSDGADGLGGGELVLADGRRLAWRQLVLATGLRDVIPELAGAAERWGRDLLQCPYCHGWEAADRPLAVLGSSPDSIQQALLVRRFSDEVTLIRAASLELEADDAAALAAMGVRVVDGEPEALVVSEDQLTAVQLADGREVACNAVYCEPGADSSSPLVAGLGCELNDDGTVRADHLGRTSVPRVWAAGNASDPSRQVVTAAGDAYRMAVAVNAFLLTEDVQARLVADSEPSAP